MSVFNELKRRNVFRVGAAYLVVAWLLLQVVDTLTPILVLSDAFARGVFVVLLLGLPVALIASWVYEFTPSGIRTQGEVDAMGKRASAGKLNTVIIAGLALALVLVVVDSYVLQPEAADAGVAVVAADATTTVTDTAVAADAAAEPGVLEKSLAVLPFANLSADAEQEYFSDGLSEELLNKLAQVDDLRVTARTSSFFYKGRNEDMRTIGQELGVNYLLEGSVRKAGDAVRITAQLIQANNGFHLWSQTYDRNLADIFALQDEIATAVTQALSITLGAGEFDRPGMTRNVEAYDAYLQAVKGIEILTTESLRQAMDHVENAVRLDPQFVQGWAAMFQTYGAAQSMFPQDQVQEFVSRQAEARQVLLEQGGELASLAAAIFTINDLRAQGNYVEAEQRALDLINDTGGRNSQYNGLYADILSTVGRNEEAINYFQLARRIDPKNPGRSIAMSRALIAANRMPEARAEIAQAVESLPAGNTDLALRRGYWLAALQEGDVDSARAIWQAEFGAPEPNTQPAYFVSGDDAQGLELTRRAYANRNAAAIATNAQAQWAMIFGDAQLALDIRREIGELSTIWMGYNTELRKLPGFMDFMEEAGIATYWRTTGNYADQCRPVNDTFECF